MKTEEFREKIDRLPAGLKNKLFNLPMGHRGEEEFDETEKATLATALGDDWKQILGLTS